MAPKHAPPNVLQEMLSLLTELTCFATPSVRIGASKIKGGGRALIAAEKLRQGVPVGPFLPLASAWRSPQLTVLNQCALCFKDKGCFGCETEIPEVQMFAQVYLKALDTHTKFAKGKPTDNKRWFGYIAERLIIRFITEQQILSTNQTAFIMDSMAKPMTGELFEDDSRDQWNSCSRDNVLNVCKVEKLDHTILEDMEKLFMNTIQAMHVNSIRGPDSSALYGGPSFMNHSCKPNCGMNFVGAACYVVPKDHIKPGTELTIDYVESFRTDDDLTFKAPSFLRFNYGIPCGVGCSCKKGRVERPPKDGTGITNGEKLKIEP